MSHDYFTKGKRVALETRDGVFLGTVTDDAHLPFGVAYVAWDVGGVRKESVKDLRPARD